MDFRENNSILATVGDEIMGIVAPVSICMLLVVLLVHSLTPHGADVTIPSVATLVYTEKSSDSTSQKLEGALLNSLVFVAMITIVTFLLVLLYYYRCIKFLKYYMCASAALVLAYMGGAVFVQIIQAVSIPIDAVTFSILLFNFTVVGVLSIFMNNMPILVTQFYLVMIGMLVAFWFTMLPEWTTWMLLIAMALYDLVAVLAPGGPLRILVELAISRDEEIPALIYEARPTTMPNNVQTHAPVPTEDPPLPISVTPSTSNNEPRPRRWKNRNRQASTTDSSGPSTEMQPRNRSAEHDDNNRDHHITVSQGPGSSSSPETLASHITSITEIRNDSDDDESAPLVSNEITNNSSESRPEARTRREWLRPIEDEDDDGIGLSASGSLKLGLGDFVFYSLLVGRAAMYDLMTVYACYLAIIAGLGSTLVLLAVARRALPALPISIGLGVIFYFLTRLLMEPLVAGLSTSLVMF